MGPWRLNFFAKNPPSGRPKWKRFEEVLHRLPKGLPLAVLTNAPMAKLLAKQPELVAAQAAIAVTPDADRIHSPYLPILAADGTDESVDLLLPFISKAVKTKSSQVDDVKNELLPLMPDTAATRGLKAVLDSTLEERTKTSPALDFAAALA